MSGCRVTLYTEEQTNRGLMVKPHKCGQPIANLSLRLCLGHVKERLRLL